MMYDWSCFSHVSFTDVSLICPSSGIYCMGVVLHDIQLAKLFDDDKYFVDMSMRQPPRE